LKHVLCVAARLEGGGYLHLQPFGNGRFGQSFDRGKPICFPGVRLGTRLNQLHDLFQQLMIECGVQLGVWGPALQSPNDFMIVFPARYPDNAAIFRILENFPVHNRSRSRVSWAACGNEEAWNEFFRRNGAQILALSRNWSLNAANAHDVTQTEAAELVEYRLPIIQVGSRSQAKAARNSESIGRL
jgi:hypothetical protein